MLLFLGPLEIGEVVKDVANGFHQSLLVAGFGVLCWYVVLGVEILNWKVFALSNRNVFSDDF